MAAALRDSEPGDTVVLQPGRHPRARVEDLSLSGIALRGQSRRGVTLAGLSLRGVSGLTVSTMTIVNGRNSAHSAVLVAEGSRDLTFRDLVIVPRVASAVDIQAGTRRIEVLDSTLVGLQVTGKRARDNTSRGVRINGEPYDDVDAWPSDITIARNDISGFGSDLIQIGGGRRITILDNDLRDPQVTDDHNDGVQSYGSDQLRIEGNRFSASGPNGPDQAIMLGHHPSIPSLRVSRTVVTGNLVASWPGTGINLAGTERTSVIGNVIGPTGDRGKPGSSIAVHGDNDLLQMRRNVGHRVYVDEDLEDRCDGCVSGS